MNTLFLKTMATGFLFVLGLMVITWIISLIKKNAGIVDIVWGFSFVLIATFYFYSSSGVILRQYLVLTLIFIWGFRLSIHIFIRNRGKGEDFRYANFRKNAGQERYWWYSFFQVFLLQAILATLISAPLLGAMFYEKHIFPTPIDIAGILVWIIGFLFESIGDLQLKRFKSDPSNKGKLLVTGLWKYTRHPNYFGDSAVWWGFALISIGGGSIIPVYGSIIMTFLLLKISGVALLEKTMNKEKPGYREYQKRTNSFFPWFPKNLK